MMQSLDLYAAGALLRAAVDIADGSADLGLRRLALIEGLADLTGAHSGHWGWMRKRPDGENYLIVAAIHWGYTEEELAAFYQFWLDARVQEEFHERLMANMRRRARADGVFTVLTSQDVPELGNPDHWITKGMWQMGVGHAVQGGRYIDDALALITLNRRPGEPDFTAAEQSLIDLAFTYIPWIWPSPDERVPQEEVEALSSRQRAVAFLLLDGLSRKKIASRLGISEETVNHHMKALFRHFNVQSATELAALFLRSQ